jgi:hypothetical protein
MFLRKYGNKKTGPAPVFFDPCKPSRRKKAGPQAGFSIRANYLAAAAASAAEAAAEAAVEAAAVASAAAEAATEAAAAASAAGVAGSTTTAGAVSTTAGATTGASSFLLQAAKATAIRETISKDFFMGFP